MERKQKKLTSKYLRQFILDPLNLQWNSQNKKSPTRHLKVLPYQKENSNLTYGIQLLQICGIGKH